MDNRDGEEPRLNSWKNCLEKWNKGKSKNFILMYNSSPLHIIVCIEEAALPQASNFFRLLFCGISRHCDKHHQSLPLFCQLQDTFGLAWINFWEIYWCRRPLVFGKISLFNVIIFLFWKGKGAFKLNCSTKPFSFETSHCSESNSALKKQKHYIVSSRRFWN